jgi:tetratricopeptide (TPR) repeat protein
MGRSMSRAAVQPGGRFRHAVSDSEFKIVSGPGGMKQTLEREGVEGTFPVAWVIGSGNHAFGYLTNVKGYLFQSPISYYSKRRLWDVAPGYEGDRNPDFTRPVTAECLWCHAGKPRPVEMTLNKYEDPPFEQEAISCDRCHGSAEDHLRKPGAGTILNPSKLAARARDSVCEQCHLSGEARIPNPGKQIGDFRPGQKLEEVFSVYVFEKRADSRLKVISHVEQLELSACQQKSGSRLWCGTCHDPHGKPTDGQGYYREKCLGCHAGAMKTHAAPVEKCIECHMPSRPARDGGHTAFTDHEIRRRPIPVGPQNAAAAGLTPWRAVDRAIDSRNLGLAYVTVGERDRSAAYLDKAQALLTEARKDYGNDPAVATGLGLLALRQRRTGEAVLLFETALRAQPGYAPYMVNLATAMRQAGRTGEAVSLLQKAIKIDPSLEPAYRRLAEMARDRVQNLTIKQVFEAYLRFMPANVNARIALMAE